MFLARTTALRGVRSFGHEIMVYGTLGVFGIEMKVIRVVIGGILLFAVLIGGWVGYEGSGNTELDVPSCTSDELQQLSGGTVDFCDKSVMMDESIPIPKALRIIIDIEVTAEWDKPDAWIGIVSADQAEKCTDSGDGYLICDTTDLEFYAGGPDTNGSIEWEVVEGNYRFVAGSSVETSGATTEIDYTYALHLTNPVVWSLAAIGALLVLTGLKD